MRGKQNLLTATYSENRITPAGAGKTSICAVRQTDTEDHPRRCGENLEYVGNACSETGSPPQVRGKRPTRSRDYPPYGITPAGAGKTFNLPTQKTIYQDHPRRCGENSPTTQTTISTTRITPAGAGKTRYYGSFLP